MHTLLKLWRMGIMFLALLSLIPQ